MGAGDSHAPCARPAPARRAQRARAGAPMGSEGLWCGARYDTAECDPRADGARACPDVRRRSTCCQDPPSHARHARRARGGHPLARLRPLPSGFGYAIVTADSVEAPLLDTDALVVVLKQARHVVSPAPVLRRRRDAAHRTSPGRADQIA
eukprot:scaffold7366_cov59-Phaeocystis_antarctica.AAC.2